MTEDPETLNVVRALLQQLCDGPQRSDTVEGIARWWLDVPVKPEVLMQALQWLKEAQLIEERHAPDHRVRFRRKADVAVLRQCLQSLQGSQPS